MNSKSKYSIRVRLLILALSGIFLWGSSILAAPTPQRKTVSSQKDRSIDEIFELSGMEAALGKIDRLFIDSNQLKNTDLPFGQADFIRNIITRVYRKREYREELVEQVKRKYNSKYARGVLKWYRSPLAKRIVQIELDSIRPYNPRRVKRYLRSFDDEKSKNERLEILQKMDVAVGYTDYEIEVLKTFAGMMFPFEKTFRGKPVAKLIESIKDKLRAPLRKQILERWLYVYRDIPTEELVEYLKFVESAAGKWYFKTMNKGSENALTLVAVRAKDYQRSIYAEVEKKGADHMLLREIAPPGHRYSLIRKRDPFAPLIIDGVLQVARAKPKSKVKIKSKTRKGKPRDVRGYGRELQRSPKIPLEVYKKIKSDDPDLYADLEFYAKLFQDKSKLKAMNKTKYRAAVSKYRALIARASEKRLLPTPLQIGYKSIKLVGVIWKHQEMVALVEVQGSRGHTVKKGLLIGPNYGIVESIKRDEIIIIERSRDYLGNILTTKKSIEFFNKSQEEG